MNETQRLAAAIRTISEKYLTNVVKANDRPAIAMWSTRLADYSTRLAVLASPPLTLKEAADLDVPEPLSKDPGVAMAQIRALLGFPLEFGPDGESRAIDGDALLAAANAQQRRELALLGFFKPVGSRPEVDYSLFTAAYERFPGTEDDWRVKPEYADTGTWQAYMAGTLK